MDETVFTLREPEAYFRRELLITLARCLIPSFLLAGACLFSTSEHLPPRLSAGLVLMAAPPFLWMYVWPIWIERRTWRARGGRDLVFRADTFEVPIYLFRRYKGYHVVARQSADGVLTFDWRNIMEDASMVGMEPEIDIALLDAPPGAVDAAFAQRVAASR